MEEKHPTLKTQWKKKHPTLDARPFLRVEAATAPAAVIAAAPTVKALLP